VFVAQAQTQLRTVLATGLRPSLRLGYIGTRHGSDARFSGSALLKGVRQERKGTEVSETPAVIWGRAIFLEFVLSSSVDLSNIPPLRCALL
jgi:phosphate-selective porin